MPIGFVANASEWDSMRVVSGKYGGRIIKTISGASGYRPATDKVREALFSILESRGINWPETDLVDFFAGSGSLGLEGLSRGARYVCFIEKNRRAVEVIKQNMRQFEISRDKYKIIPKNAFSVIKNPPNNNFQLFFIDPPYGFNMVVPALENIASKWELDPGAIISVEVEKELDLQHVNIPGLRILEDRVYGQTRIYLWIPENKQ